MIFGMPVDRQDPASGDGWDAELEWLMSGG